jgi:uncharacterized membrane protein HdeD (DUF308 family)
MHPDMKSSNYWWLIAVVAAITIRQIRGWIFILIAGLISITFGLLIICYPMKRASGITVFIGFFALIMGILYVFDAVRFRKYAYTLDLVL